MNGFLIFSDIHIHKYSGNQERLDNCIKALETLFFIAEEKGLIILFAGDLFDRCNPSTEALHATYQVFKKYESVPFICIVGNHDYVIEEGLSAVDILADTCKNIKPIEGWVDYHVYRIHGINFKRDTKVFRKWLKAAPLARRTNILLTHQTFKGSGFIDYDTDPSDKLYQKFEIVINGHIHKRKVIGNYYNVGSVIHRDLDDVGQKKGYYIYQNGDMLFHYLPGFYEVPKQKETKQEIEEDIPDFKLKKGRNKLLKKYWKLKGMGDKELLILGQKFIKK